AFLRHVADQDDRRAALLGGTYQQGSALADLGDTAWGRLQLLCENGLDGVHYHDSGLLTAGSGYEVLDTGLGHDLELVPWQAEAFGAHGHLLLGFLTGHIERWHAAGQLSQGRPQYGGFADTRLAADQPPALTD